MRLKFLFFVVMAVGFLTQNADAQGRGRAPQADVQGRGDTPHPHPSKVYGYITLFDGQQRHNQWHMTRNAEIADHFADHRERYAYWPRVPSARVVFRAVNGGGSQVVTLDETTLGNHPFDDYCTIFQSKALKYEIFFVLDARAATPSVMFDRPGLTNRPGHPLEGRVEPDREIPVIYVAYSPDHWMFDRIEVDPVQIPTLFVNSSSQNRVIDHRSYVPVPLRPVQLLDLEFPNEQ